jgi:hypothetical protein
MAWEEIMDLILRWAIPCILGGIAAFIQKDHKHHQAFERAMCALLRDRIIGLYDQYRKQGYCPICGRDNMMALYDQYKLLGGNGQTDDLVQRTLALPTEALP